MTAGPECAKLHSSPLTYPEVVTGDHGALANVLVYVKSGLGKYRYDLPAAPATLDQVGCMYEPHVLGLMAHEKLDIKNTDPIVHNVHPVPHKNRAWNQSQPIGSAAIETEFDHPDFAIPVLCNLHPWMRAYVFVFSHPYFDGNNHGGHIRPEEPASRHLHDRGLAGEIRHPGPDGHHRPQGIEGNLLSFQRGRLATIQTPSAGSPAAPQLTKSLCKAYTSFTGPK